MSNLVALPNGTELAGDFRIKKVLGAGGFGITYLADELALGRQVTIKEYFPTDYAARKSDLSAFPRSRESAEDYKWGLDRFIDEAKTLARFDHPNIVRVYRYFRANNTGYMVLQFEEGGSFKTWLRGLGRAPRQTELDALMSPLLDALEVIHKGDFLHRDIAPDNIIVRRDKTPVLIDFGSARGEIASQSRTVSALVKPGYSPYEQYASNTRQQGPWTDIYALGATFYQAIAGKRPPDAPSRMVRDEYIPAREAAIGSYRASFLAAIDKALRLEVTERPQSIADWRGPLLAPDPKPAASKPARAKIGDVLGIKRTAVVAEVTPAASAAATVVIPPAPDAPLPRGQLLDFVDGLRKAVQPAAQAAAPIVQPTAPAGSLVAALQAVEQTPPFGLGYGGAPIAAAAPQAPAARAAPPFDEKLQPLRSTALASPAPPLHPVTAPQPVERRSPRRRRQLWFFLRNPWRGLLLKFATGIAVASLFTIYQEHWPLGMVGPRPSAARQAAPNPATPKQVALAPRQDSAVPPAETSSPLQLASQQLVGPTGSVTAVCFLGDTRRVATIGTDATLRLWDGNTGAMLRLIALPEGAATALAAQETLALTGHSDGKLVLWDLEKGERLATFRRSADALTAVAFAPESDRFIAAGKDGTLAVWDRKAAATPVQVIDHSGGVITRLVRVPANDAVAYTLADNTVYLSRSEGLTPIRSYRGHTGTITAIGSPENGRSLASATSDGQIRVWSTRTNKVLKSFQAHAGPVTALSYASSGDVLSSIGTDGYLKIWDARKGRLLAAAPRNGAAVNAMAIAADGRHLATAGTDGSVHLWDAGGIRLARD